MKDTKLLWILLLSLLISLLLGCPSDLGSSNTIIWNGAWENSSHYYGTFTLDMTFDGENMDRHGGEGTILGHIIWTGYDGAAIVDRTVSGTWENDLSGDNHDLLGFTIISDDGFLSLSSYIHYETAGEITSETSDMGSFNLNTIDGSWHTTSTSDGIDNPNITSAVSINQDGQFHDLTYIDGGLYGTVFSDPEYMLVRIDIADGTVSEIDPVGCAEPYSITNNGTLPLIVGRENNGDTDACLFTYGNKNFDSNVNISSQNPDLNNVITLSFSGSTLYYHNGAVLTPVIGSVNLSTAAISLLIGDIFNSPPPMARTTKIAAVSGAFYTTYFAPGDVWCEIRKLNTSGTLISSSYTPVNTTGPIAINGSTLYIVQGNPNRLYVIQL